MIQSSTRVTRPLDKPVSTSIAGHSRVKLSTTVRIRSPRPVAKILDGNGLMTAAKQSDKPKDTRNDDQRATSLFSPKIKMLCAAGILANDRF
jgi:hypothetical protein